MEQLLPQCWSTNSVPRAFFPRVAIGCRLLLKIDRNLSSSWAGGLSVATWYDTAWIGGTASGYNIYTDLCYQPRFVTMWNCIKIWPVVFKLWAVFLSRKCETVFKVWCCQHLITLAAYHTIFLQSYVNLWSVIDQVFAQIYRHTRRQTPL